MALSYSESICQNCMKLAKEAEARGDTTALLKYALAMLLGTLFGAKS